jgi:hypothetical protein
VAAGYEAKPPALFKTALPYFARFVKFKDKKPIKSAKIKAGIGGRPRRRKRRRSAAASFAAGEGFSPIKNK